MTEQFVFCVSKSNLKFRFGYWNLRHFLGLIKSFEKFTQTVEYRFNFVSGYADFFLEEKIAAVSLNRKNERL